MALALSPVATLFLLVILAGLLVMVISKTLDRLWARTIPARFVYQLISAPGVVVHECAHVLGCLITGARIKKVVLFSGGGGSVTYQPPPVPLLGNIIISTAPLFVIPLVLAGLTWLFGTYTGCSLTFPALTLDTLAGAGALVTGSALIVWQNLVVQFNAWFLLYLYLALSCVLSLAPSMQDIRNAAAGLAILVAAGVLIIVGNVAIIVSLFGTLLHFLATGFALGLVFELLAVFVSFPILLVIHLVRR
jgi:ABC-type multidrug transport system fused ATPase/permease subunit